MLALLIRASFQVSLLVALVSFAIGCSPKSQDRLAGDGASPGVVYGEDSVAEINESSDPRLIALAKLTAVQVTSGYISQTPSGSYTFGSSTLGEQFGLCSDERDANELAPGNCSGVLIGPDLILTAGHCVRTQEDCTSARWVLNFHRSKLSVPREDVYSCVEIMDRQEDDSGTDYAVLRLDRVAPQYQSLNIELSPNALSVGEPILVLGYPGGRPLRSTTGTVRSTNDLGFFVGNPDTYGGNSGSPVFSLRSGKLVGVLVRGEADYESDPSGCLRSLRCGENDCRGEDSTRLSSVKFLTGGPVTPGPIDPTPSGGTRWVWLDSDRTCNLFEGDTYIREVPNQECLDRGVAEGRYVWLDSDNTCNYFIESSYIEEVANSFCGR